MWLVCLMLLPAAFEAKAEPTQHEIDHMKKQVFEAFTQFLKLWREERYFELYEWGKKQSQDHITPEEFATRMVELSWVPEGLEKEPPLEISFRFRTLIYVSATVHFRHKTNSTRQLSKTQHFQLVWEEDRWRFDLLQMLRSPFYTPASESSVAK